MLSITSSRGLGLPGLLFLFRQIPTPARIGKNLRLLDFLPEGVVLGMVLVGRQTFWGEVCTKCVHPLKLLGAQGEGASEFGCCIGLRIVESGWSG